MPGADSRGLRPARGGGRLRPCCFRNGRWPRRRAEKIRPGGCGRYAAVLAGLLFRGICELGQPNGSRHRTMAAPAACHKLQQPCTRARQGAPDEFRQRQGAVAPISTQPGRGRFSASVRQRSAHSPRVLHEFHRGGWGATRPSRQGRETEQIPPGQGGSPIRSTQRRPNRRGKRATCKTPAPTRTEGV